MAGVKISALPAVPSAAALTDIFPVVQGGVTYKETLTQLATLFNANLTFLPLAGGTMSGAIDMGNHKITTLATPTVSTDAATKAYADLMLPLAGGTMTGIINMNSHKITNLTDPTLAQDAATKFYVDSVAQGLTIQGACRVGTTVALTVTYANGTAGVGATLTNAGVQAAIAIDGVTLALNDRVLVKNQAATLQNGIYTVTTLGSGATNWVMTRALDYDQPAEIQPGDLVVLTSGTQANSSWLETATVTAVGTDPITFSQFTASLPITVPNGGTGLTTTTAYGIITGGTTATGNFQNTGTGATGTVLQGNGAAALPTFSTATYPSVATSTGSFIYANGTNYVASTSLWPNTVGTAGKIVRSDGTTNAYTTSTFADTYGVSTLLYASSANTVSGLATAASGVLVTSAGGVPSISSTLPAFTTSSITFNPTTGGIVGTTTNDNAAAGKVGEFISSVIASGAPVTFANSTNTDLTSISLTAGDWDVWGNLNYLTLGSVPTEIFAWISSTSAATPDASLYNTIAVGAITSNLGIISPSLRFSLSGTTIIYISGAKVGTSGNATVCGGIYARRAR